MNTIGDRLREFASKKNLSIRAFENSCGLTNGIVQRCVKGLNSDNIEKIASTYPDLDLNWLILGVKSSRHINSLPQQENAENERLWAVIKSQQETIDNLINMKVKWVKMD